MINSNLMIPWDSENSENYDPLLKDAWEQGEDLLFYYLMFLAAF